MQNILLSKGRDACSRLGAFIRKAMPMLIVAAGYGGAKAQNTESDFKFNDGVRYSQWVINSRMNNFYANTTKVGFAVYAEDGSQTTGRVDGKDKLDYVPGLVAKGIVEAAAYYKQYTWATWAKPWFLSIEDYGNKFASTVATGGGSLDDLNAVKIYLPLRELSAPGGSFANTTTYNNTTSAIDKAINGLNAHNTNCRIKSGTIAENAGYDVVGGWWHKTAYNNQMWLDGQYMGSALLAQLVNYDGKTNNITSNEVGDDWDLAVKQLDIVWKLCWNETDKLLYHAFDANAGTNSNSHSETWQGISSTEPYCFHSATYWGRACGWYFLALVDMLEQMDKYGMAKTDARYQRLKGYLEQLAAGLKARQDAATGGWYQILDEDGTFHTANYNNGQSHTDTYNYIESSATAIFAATYLKAIRLGYIDKAAYEETAKSAYRCLVNQFFATDGKEGVHIFGSCRSAGLGDTGSDAVEGKLKFRDGSKAYYLLGRDVMRVDKDEKVTEGKILGAFILAATEYERLYQKDKAILFTKDLAPQYDLTTGGTASITIEAKGESTPTYQWYKSDGTKAVGEGATSGTFTPEESGDYYCEATAGNTTIRSGVTSVKAAEKTLGETEKIVVPATSGKESVLFYTDFTEEGWKNINLGTAGDKPSDPVIINGTSVTVYGKGFTFDTTKGTVTIGNNPSINKNCFSIPIKKSDINNNTINIEVIGSKSNAFFQYALNTASSFTSTSGDADKTKATLTLDNPTDDITLLIGRGDRSNKIITSIKITTPGTGTGTPEYTKYSYKVATNYITPGINEVRTMVDGSTELMKLSFGGWKRNNNTYTTKTNAEVTDSWGAAKAYGGTAVDGCKAYFEGANPALDETKASFTEGQPFSLPVRGAYMTAEPAQDGKLGVYVIHSGNFYITDMHGKVLKKATSGSASDMTKYEDIEVKAGGTYYMFSDNSAMSFCGASFIPAETQPGETAALSDTKAYAAPAEATGYSEITLDRTMKGGQWNTMALPFDMTQGEVEATFGEGTQIIILDRAQVTGDAVNLHFTYHEIQGILAGYPYLIKPAKEINSIVLNNKWIDPAAAQNNINCGDYTAKGTPGYSTANVTNAAGANGYSQKYASGDIFVSDGNGGLYISEGKSYGKGYRSYISKNAGTAAAKAITMMMSGVEDNDEHGTTTAISITELTPEAAQAAGFDGVYNLNGQKVAGSATGLPTGIYIVNGHKMIIK